ncbi:DUF2892 domain-containing protein [Moraxella sp.]|uniref:YgaP family membrane protein n=1 Tax=Moraxella sp. TaxID=479 RepID=UPI0026DB88A4|nr:DUF2892 domain-containing protein [Moraxella sp.]MDO4895207.1 DUF2892 domain-containing protein [Moraxella sp.]
MKINVGKADKIIRIILGLVLIGLVIGKVIGWWGLIGLIPLATGMFNFCPIYHLLGINSCGLPKK